jgi:S1-C subfamily serine protease
MNHLSRILKHPGRSFHAMLLGAVVGCLLGPQLQIRAGETRTRGLYDGMEIASGDSQALTIIPEQMAEHFIASLRGTEPLRAGDEFASQQARPRGLTLSAVYRKAAPAVVVIVVGGGKSFGSGFLISKDGKILTNHHVVKNGLLTDNLTREVTIGFGELDTNGSMKPIVARFPAQVYKWDKTRDLALLKLAGSPFKSGHEPPVFKLASASPPPGEDVVAIGNAGVTLSWSLKAGVVEAVGRNILDTALVFAAWEQFIHNSADKNVRGAFPAAQRAVKAKFAASEVVYIQASCAIKHGDSGGPLLNMKGELVGVNDFGRSDQGGGSANYFIHVNEVKSFLQDQPPGPIQTLPSPWELGATACQFNDLDHDGKLDTMKFYWNNPTTNGVPHTLAGIGWDAAEESDLTKYISTGSSSANEGAKPKVDAASLVKDRAMRFQAYMVKDNDSVLFAYDLNRDGHFEIVRLDRGAKGTADIAWESEGPGKPYQRTQSQSRSVLLPSSSIPDLWRARYEKVVLGFFKSKEEKR